MLEQEELDAARDTPGEQGDPLEHLPGTLKHGPASHLLHECDLISATEAEQQQLDRLHRKAKETKRLR